MKRLAITITIKCQSDIPSHVVAWMAGNLREHVEREFGLDYDPRWVTPSFEGPPVTAGNIDVEVKAETP